MTKTQGLRFRRHLSAPGLVKLTRKCFERIDDPIKGHRTSLADNMMAALAMSMFKFPSMLQFDEFARGREALPELIHNLETLFGIGHVPSDTSMRERLDALDPQALRSAFKLAFSELQRCKGLEGVTSIDGHHCLALC
ncbi:MAG: hypothetical protein J4F49_05325 [Rhodobacteraceae bacterium]|nr:hypothetical protein [Paracoccaceae bacterium]